MATLEPAVTALRGDLRNRADLRRARLLRRESPGEIPFIGLTPLTVVQVVRRHLDDPAWRDLDRDRWQASLTDLWSTDTTREFRYATVAIVRHPRSRPHAASPRSTTFYRDLLLDRPTLDTVDALAAFALPLVLDSSPESEGQVVRNWSVVGSPWLRRAALLAQIRRGRHADPHLLRACIGANLAERRRIVRSAIPIAVAAYARSHPEDRDEMRDMYREWTDRMPATLADELSDILFTDDHASDDA